MIYEHSRIRLFPGDRVDTIFFFNFNQKITESTSQSFNAIRRDLTSWPAMERKKKHKVDNRFSFPFSLEAVIYFRANTFSKSFFSIHFEMEKRSAPLRFVSNSEKNFSGFQRVNWLH